MSFEMEKLCKNFDKLNGQCLHCTQQKLFITEDTCFKRKDADEKRTIKCKCGWIGKTDEPVDILATYNLNYLLRQHVAEKHYKEFEVIK